MPKITVHAPDLLRALRLVKHAAADIEDGRPIIATILFEGDADGFRLVAADNYRIGIAKLDVEGDRETFGRGPLPLDELPVVLAVLGRWKFTAEVTLADSRLTFSAGGRTATVRTVDGTYPDYRPVLEGERRTLGVNATFLADIGRATKGTTARIFVGAWNTPIEVQVEELDYREYIMPVRLAEHTSDAGAAINRPESAA